MCHARTFLRAGPYRVPPLIGKRSWYKAAMQKVAPLRSPLLAEHGFKHGFSPRRGGISAAPFDTCNLGRGVGDEPSCVAENRRRFAAAVGYAEETLFEVNQVHGRDVRAVAPGDLPAQLVALSADGLVADGGRTVGVRTADCVPVLVADPTTRAVAALHAGWRGTAFGVIGVGVESLRKLAAAPAERLIASLFPHIGVCCFEVSEEVAETLVASLPRTAAGEVVRRVAGGKPRVDLSAILRQQLMAAGVPARQIDLVAGCTRCDAESFFSYRRDGQASGRHLTAIVAD